MEDVRHLAGGQLGLHQVVTLGATRLVIHGDLDVGVGCLEPRDQGLADRDGIRRVLGQEGDLGCRLAFTAGLTADLSDCAARQPKCQGRECANAGREDASTSYRYHSLPPCIERLAADANGEAPQAIETVQRYGLE